MSNLRFVLLLLAFVCFVLAAVGVSTPRINLTGLGLAFWVAASFALG